MVGTSIVAEILCFSIASRTAPGSNAGSTISAPPRSRVGMKNAAPACDSGVQMRKRGSSGHCHSAIWIWLSVAPDW